MIQTTKEIEFIHFLKESLKYQSQEEIKEKKQLQLLEILILTLLDHLLLSKQLLLEFQM